MHRKCYSACGLGTAHHGEACSTLCVPCANRAHPHLICTGQACTPRHRPGFAPLCSLLPIHLRPAASQVSVVPEGQEEGPGALSPPRTASPSHRDRRNSAGSTSKSRLGMTPSGHHGDADLGRNSTGASGADAALTGRASTGASKLSKANSFVHVFKRDSETRAKDCAIM